MSRLTVGEALAARLFAAETAVDQALIEVATFAAALPAARTDAWLSAVTGQRAFDGADRGPGTARGHTPGPGRARA